MCRRGGEKSDLFVCSGNALPGAGASFTRMTVGASARGLRCLQSDGQWLHFRVTNRNAWNHVRPVTDFSDMADFPN